MGKHGNPIAALSSGIRPVYHIRLLEDLSCGVIAEYTAEGEGLRRSSESVWSEYVSINYCACETESLCFRGRSASSFPEQRLVAESSVEGVRLH